MEIGPIRNQNLIFWPLTIVLSCENGRGTTKNKNPQKIGQNKCRFPFLETSLRKGAGCRTFFWSVASYDISDQHSGVKQEYLRIVVSLQRQKSFSSPTNCI